MDYKNPLNQLPKNPKRQAVIFLLLTLLVSLGLVAVPQPAMAAVRTWSGDINTSWTNAFNWEGGTVPVAADTATIPSVTNLPVISTTVTISGLTINAGASANVGWVKRQRTHQKNEKRQRCQLIDGSASSIQQAQDRLNPSYTLFLFVTIISLVLDWAAKP